VVASLLPVVAVRKKHVCTAAAAAAGTVGDCPNIAFDDDVAVLKVGYTTRKMIYCNTLEQLLVSVGNSN
jgi:hypothetical protein